ncbi:MAG TPA: peroxiredoxin [Rhodoblastus sp.]|nr:peroxiredoxin [Rhodoblastus sp.]
MKRTLVLAAVLASAVAVAQAALPVGANAPDFRIQGALAGKDFSFSLADALKKGPVVVYFYPKSFTSVCTEEAHLFAEAAGDFVALGASVLGVSGDDIETQRKFSSLECRDKFAVGADADRAVMKAYDVGGRSPYAARVSYVIAPDNRILSVVSSSEAQPHIEGALQTLRAWRAARKS